jgi:hypothetical protein
VTSKDDDIVVVVLHGRATVLRKGQKGSVSASSDCSPLLQTGLEHYTAPHQSQITRSLTGPRPDTSTRTANSSTYNNRPEARKAESATIKMNPNFDDVEERDGERLGLGDHLETVFDR